MYKLKQSRLAEKITKINELANIVYNELCINVPKYILDEIVDGGNKDNIIALIGLAKINERISGENTKVLIKNIDKYLCLK